MKIKRNQSGFTLIEVVLVLAIGGLIFLLAFLAFQQVSTNRRDTQRRNDAGKVIAEVQNATGDGSKISSQATLTGGTAAVAPAAAAQTTITGGFVKTYFNGSLKGPGDYYGWTYTAVTTADVTPAGTKDIVYFANNAKCKPDAGGVFTPQTGANAVIVGLEKGAVCRDDQ